MTRQATPFALRLPEGMIAKLECRARRDRRTVTNAIHVAIETWLESRVFRLSEDHDRIAPAPGPETFGLRLEPDLKKEVWQAAQGAGLPLHGVLLTILFLWLEDSLKSASGAGQPEFGASGSDDTGHIHLQLSEGLASRMQSRSPGRPLAEIVSRVLRKEFSGPIEPEQEILQVLEAASELRRLLSHERAKGVERAQEAAVRALLGSSPERAMDAIAPLKELLVVHLERQGASFAGSPEARLLRSAIQGIQDTSAV